jgi:hypothetical protein
MCTILLVSSSPRGSASYSKQIAESVIGDLRKKDPNARLIVRDLAQAPLPHIDDDFITATRGPDGLQTQRQPAVLAISGLDRRALRRRHCCHCRAHACKMGLEGIVSKRKDSAYRSGRSPDWLKMKNAGNH